MKWILFLIGYLVVSVGVPFLTTLSLPSSLCWKAPITGPITAIAVVFYSYFSAPKYPQSTVIVGFVFGALLAYQIPYMHWYPECHPKAYMQTFLPLTVTYLSGLGTVITILWWSKSKM